jgi:3-oxoacyl-[acyl-carrier-protein] synthase-3
VIKLTAASVGERFFVNVDQYGNTSAANIGIALDELSRSGKLNHEDVVLLVGFGAGLTWSKKQVKS